MVVGIEETIDTSRTQPRGYTNQTGKSTYHLMAFANTQSGHWCTLIAILGITASRMQRKLYIAYLIDYGMLTDIQSYGLMFFGTPHAGPKDSPRVSLGKACVQIVQSLPGFQANENMDALKHGSLFDDFLQDSFRHQLLAFHIVSFYERNGKVSLHFLRFFQ